jgi:hypothetical protein
VGLQQLTLGLEQVVEVVEVVEVVGAVGAVHGGVTAVNAGARAVEGGVRAVKVVEPSIVLPMDRLVDGSPESSQEHLGWPDGTISIKAECILRACVAMGSSNTL